MTPPVKDRRLKLENLTRMEGEGGLDIRVQGDSLDVKLSIFEPPRFFEAFLRGRHCDEVPDLTARICGICPVAYQMSSVHALEAALGITPSLQIRQLRRLLYCGEWIQSHALHIYLLQLPDFLGKESIVPLAAERPEDVRRGLRLKQIGNHVMELLGGRSVHPISVCIGGFHKTPSRAEMRLLHDELAWALDAAIETVHLVAGLNFPEFNPDYEFLCLSHPREYAMNEGNLVSSRCASIEVSEFEQVFLEEHVEHSTALQSVRAESETSYFVGPLARINLNMRHLLPRAHAIAESCGVTWPCSNPYKGAVARGIEMVHACEEALAIVDNYEEPPSPRTEVRLHAGEGCAATEAPRGTLYHRYRINEQGLIEFAKIVPPTAQNLRRIEDDLRLLLPGLLEQPDSAILDACEKLVRNYDPCISCSTHFLKLRLQRG